MSSRPETPTQATGAHRAHRDARQRVVPRSVPQAPPARYEPCLDGLFTYCLSVLCDHEAATAALGDVLAIAERRGSRGPATEAELKSWLYALARWVCLRALADAKRKRQGAHASGSASRVPKASEPAGSAQSAGSAGSAEAPAPPDETELRRRRELAQLAWPEAAGTTPEQREALELAVRHQLSPQEVAAVVGMDVGRTRELLASAACEVERTRAALAVVETGNCPIVARLTGDNQLLLGTALRRELVRHVDDCPRCRRTAERAGSGAWPGTAASPAALPVIEAPRAAVHVAMAHVPRARGGGPRFDRRGFPVDPKDHAARRDRMRARVVTTTVVATVVAAPVLALWAAYRGAPLTGEGQDGRSVSASDAGPDGSNGDRRPEDYENAGNADTPPDPRFTAGSRSPDVSVEVISSGSPPSRSGTGAGRLTVAAQSSGGTTLITLSASGGEPVHWSASAGAPWLYLSRSSGTLAPGETSTIRVYVDHSREPAGHWSARVSVAPSGAIISIGGYGSGSGRPTHPGPRPTTTPPKPRPTPTTPDPTTPTPTTPDPTPTTPDPTPTPSDPGNSTPPPSDSGDPSPSGS
ncbi:BACON domain-containing protein [Streptomyces sp. NPDC055189]